MPADARRRPYDVILRDAVRRQMQLQERTREAAVRIGAERVAERTTEPSDQEERRNGRT